MDLMRIPLWAADGEVNVIVETPRGAQVKYLYDPSLEAFTISKVLLTGLAYPTDFGFFPSTIAPDGDPLDALILHDVGTFSGLVMRCRVIGVLEVSQKEPGRRFPQRSGHRRAGPIKPRTGAYRCEADSEAAPR